jgi:anti-anti-sigma factor
MGDNGPATVRARCVGDAAVIYASNYLNKFNGERIERECRQQLAAGRRALVINFRDTELVNSIGVSILMGVIDAAEQNDARLVFANASGQTLNLFEMLGLSRQVKLTNDEEEALLLLSIESATGR